MTSTHASTPAVSVLAEHVSEHLSVFVVGEDTDAKRPANGGRGCSTTQAMQPALPMVNV